MSKSEIRKGPAASKGGSEVGNERKANMEGALYGNPSEHNPLKAGIDHLKANHARGVKHMPLHGMHPKGSHGR